MMSEREADQRSFPKCPFRSGLLLSCLSASQRELAEVHECLLGHFGCFHFVQISERGPKHATRLRGRSEVATAELNASINVPPTSVDFVDSAVRVAISS
jgi:hypothetical protein